MKYAVAEFLLKGEPLQLLLYKPTLGEDNLLFLPFLLFCAVWVHNSYNRSQKWSNLEIQILL